MLALKVPMVSISITVLKALKESEAAGQRKFPAASVKINNCILAKVKSHEALPHEKPDKPAENPTESKLMLHCTEGKIIWGHIVVIALELHNSLQAKIRAALGQQKLVDVLE